MKTSQILKALTSVAGLSAICLPLTISSCNKKDHSEQSLLYITVTNKPKKIKYTAGEKLDLTEMVVTATYSDGAEEEITNYTTSPESGTVLKTTDKQVSVSYLDKSYLFPITVESDIKLVEITNVTYSGSTTYETAVLKPDVLSIKGKMSDETIVDLEIGRGCQIFEGTNNITPDVLSDTGYKMNSVKTYDFKVVATLDQTKTKDFQIEVVEPLEEQLFQASKYGGGNNCIIKAKAKCLALDEIVIPAKFKVNGVMMNVRAVDSEGFKNAKATKITFEDISSIDYISSNAFENCVNLKTFDWPSKVEKIASNTFYGCKSLTEINGLTGIKTINERVFQGCSSLKTITLSNCTQVFDYAFADSGIQTFTVPTRLVYIAANTFNNASALNTVRFENTSVWRQFGKTTALNVTNDSSNARYLKNCDSTSSNNWGYTGIGRSDS